MKKLLLIVLFYLPINVFSQQNVGYLQLYVYPDQCKISINDTLFVTSKSKTTLPQGTHKINISAPKLKSISEIITIQKDSTLVYRKILGYNDSFKLYKSEMTEYSLKKGAMVTSTTLLAGLTLYLTYNFTINAKNRQKEAYDNVIRYRNLYRGSYNVEDISYYKIMFNENKVDYYKYRNQRTFAIPVALLGSFLTYKSLMYTLSIKKPKYNEPISFNYNMFNNQFYISYEF